MGKLEKSTTGLYLCLSRRLETTSNGLALHEALLNTPCRTGGFTSSFTWRMAPHGIEMTQGIFRSRGSSPGLSVSQCNETCSDGCSSAED